MRQPSWGGGRVHHARGQDVPAGKPEKEAEARGPELRPRVLGGEEIVYSKQNRSLRCVYTEIGRNIFYRFFVGLLWNTNGSEETHPPLSLAARKGVLWLCFGLLRLLYQPRVALYEFLIPLVLAHRLQKVFPMPMCHRSTVVCWFGNNGGAGKAASARDALSSFAQTR